MGCGRKFRKIEALRAPNRRRVRVFPRRRVLNIPAGDKCLGRSARILPIIFSFAHRSNRKLIYFIIVYQLLCA